jgi:L-cysteine/cystine lyase
VNVEAIRAELPVLERVAYLNTGTFGPLPRRVVEAMEGRLRAELAGGRMGRPYFDDVMGLRAGVRNAVAGILGAPPDAVALTRSTGEGCNIAVASLHLGPEDEIVTTDDEHFGLLGPLHASGARVRVARIRDLPLGDVAAAIEAEIGDRTRLIALSHVTWTTGRILPVAAFTRRGIPVLVDGAQSVGAIPVDVEELGCDFYTVSGQKWLLGPDGTGALYVRRELCDRLWVPFPSYFSQAGYDDTGKFVPAPGAARFEPGTLSAPALAGLGEALAFADQVGPERYERARAMQERCRSALEGVVEVLTEPGQATIVSFRPKSGTPPEVVAALAERGVVVRDFPGLDWIRASIGFWTIDEEIERLAEGLR